VHVASLSIPVLRTKWMYLKIATLGVFLSLALAVPALAIPTFTINYQGQSHQSSTSGPVCPAPCAIVASYNGPPTDSVQWSSISQEGNRQIVGSGPSFSTNLSPGLYQLQVIANGEYGGIFAINVASAQDLPRPIYFTPLGAITAGRVGSATVLTAATARPYLDGTWRSNGLLGNLDLLSRSGPDNAGLYWFSFRIPRANGTPAAVEFNLASFQTADELATGRTRDVAGPFSSTIVGDTGQDFDLSSAVTYGWTGSKYQVTGAITGFATKSYQCGGGLQIEQRQRGWRLLKQGKLRCSGGGSFFRLTQQVSLTLSKSQYRSLQRRHVRIRFRWQPTLNSGKRVVFAPRSAVRAITTARRYA